MNSRDLIGAGWAFPGELTAAGEIRLVGGTEEIEAAVRMILATAPGERLMRPDFGCTLWEQLFAPVDATTLGLMEHAVRGALERWEPRIEVEAVEARPGEEDDEIRIDIGYRVKATSDRRSLVYPFYVIPREKATS